MFEPDETGRRPILDWTLKEWALMAVVLPVAFALAFGAAFLLFGGWAVLPEPWSTATAVAVYGTAALLFVADALGRRRSRK